MGPRLLYRRACPIVAFSFGGAAGVVLYSVNLDGLDDSGTAGTRGKGNLVWTTTR